MELCDGWAGWMGACTGPSLNKELAALTGGAEAGARPGLGDFCALWRSRRALWGCLCP